MVSNVFRILRNIKVTSIWKYLKFSPIVLQENKKVTELVDLFYTNQFKILFCYIPKPRFLIRAVAS